MPEVTRTFLGYERAMYASFKTSVSAREEGDAQKVLSTLEMAVAYGSHALNYRGEVSEEHQGRFLKFLTTCSNLYWHEIYFRMSEDEIAITVPVMEFWIKSVCGPNGPHCTEQVINLFDNAKEHLDFHGRTIKMYYRLECTPDPLRAIMLAFADGSLSRKETETRLTEYAAKLRKLLPKALPSEAVR